jgi:hypothetical protein
MRKKNVLVCNDDGVRAPGIVALVRALVAADFCNIQVVAPATEQSAKSQALTLGQAIVVDKCECHAGVRECLAVYGTPADSVMVAPALLNVWFLLSAPLRHLQHCMRAILSLSAWNMVVFYTVWLCLLSHVHPHYRDSGQDAGTLAFSECQSPLQPCALT